MRKMVISVLAVCLLSCGGSGTQDKGVSKETDTRYTDNMPTVMGVTFGSPYIACLKILDERFNGGEASYQNDYDGLIYRDIKVGGEHFDHAIFDFEPLEGNAYLCAISLKERADTSEAANMKEKFDRLVSSYSKKYDYRYDFNDKKGMRFCVLGHNPLDYEDGFVLIGIKRDSKEVSVDILYGPVDFKKSPQSEI